MIVNLFFYLFAVILLASAAMVVSARNPVHSVLFLILSFFHPAALFVIARALADIVGPRNPLIPTS